MSSTSIAFDIVARDNASRSLDHVGDAADRVGRDVDGAGKKMRKFALLAGAGLAAGAVIVGKALVDMTKNAAEDAAAQRKLALALKNTTGAGKEQVAQVENWISKQGVALGVTDDELRPAFQRLVQATGSVSEAQKQMHIAMDVSAGTGKSLKTVSEALMKANNGTTASLSKLGLKTKDAEGNTLTLKQALKSMSDTFAGQAAAKANTLEGKMGRLKLIMDETKETIGAQLIPVVTKLADWFLNKAYPAINAFVQGMQDGTGAGGQVMAVLEKVGAVLSAVSKFLWDNKEAVGVVVAALGAWKVAQIALNLVLSANPIGLVVVAIGALVFGLVTAYQKVGWFHKAVDGAFKGISAVVGWTVGFIKDHWQTILVILTGPVGAAVLIVIKNFDKLKAGGQAVFKAIAAAGKWMWNNVLQPVFSFLVKGIATVLDMWSKMLGALGHVPGFGWAKDAADAMANAADKARSIGSAIQKIPNNKDVDVYIRTHVATISHVGPGGAHLPDSPSPRPAGGRLNPRGSIGGRSGRGALGGSAEDLLAAAVDLLARIADQQSGGTNAGQAAYLLGGEY